MKARAFIFVTIMLDMLALGIIIPVLQPLILQFEGGRFADTSLVSGLFATAFAFVQFFSSPVLGTLSDMVGRRPVVLLSNLGTSLDYAILALAPNVEWLFAGRIIAGATTGSITVASAYIADVTPEEQRAGAYGMISMAFGIGFIVGPALGGMLGAHDIRLPFWVAGALSLINFFYGLFVLPESLAKDHRNPFSWSRANPLGAVRMLRRHAELAGLSVVNLIGYVAHEALPQIFVLYTLFAFGWTMATVGVSLAVVGIATIVISGFCIKPIVKRLGERRAIAAGLFCGAIGFGLYAGNEVLFWIGILVNMLWMVASAASQSLMTRRVGKHEQGELQGAINLLRSVGMLLGPPLITGVFAYSVSSTHAWKFPALPFLVAGALLLVSLAVAWNVTSPSDDAAPEIETSAAFEAALVSETPIVS